MSHSLTTSSILLGIVLGQRWQNISPVWVCVNIWIQHRRMNIFIGFLWFRRGTSLWTADDLMCRVVCYDGGWWGFLVGIVGGFWWCRICPCWGFVTSKEWASRLGTVSGLCSAGGSGWWWRLVMRMKVFEVRDWIV